VAPCAVSIFTRGFGLAGGFGVGVAVGAAGAGAGWAWAAAAKAATERAIRVRRSMARRLAPGAGPRHPPRHFTKVSVLPVERSRPPASTRVWTREAQRRRTRPSVSTVDPTRASTLAERPAGGPRRPGPPSR